QTTLCRGDRPSRVEATVDLTAQYVAHTRHKREDLEVQWLGLQRLQRPCWLGPARTVCTVEIDKLAEATRRDLCKRPHSIRAHVNQTSDSGGGRRLPCVHPAERDGLRGRACGAPLLTACLLVLARRPLRTLDRDLPALAIPVGLAQLGAISPASLRWACGMKRHPLRVHTQRDSFGDERRLPALGGAPADDRVMSRKVQSSIGVSQRGEML